jgi:hypothetical protein
MKVCSISTRTYFSILSVLMLLSTLLYGGAFFKISNSDQAIYVMMTQDFSLSKTLYYWGQDRFGSLLPALAHPLTYIMPAVWALTILQMLSLWGAWYIWSSFLQTHWQKIILAIALWIPPLAFYYSAVIAQPYHILLLLWGWALYLFPKQKTTAHLLAGFIISIAYWVSEMSIVLVIWWLISALFFARKKIPFAIIGAIPGILLILAAKKNATRIPLFSEKMLVSTQELGTSLERLWMGLLHEAFIFEIQRIAASLGHILLLVVFLFLIAYGVLKLFSWLKERTWESWLRLSPLVLLIGFFGLSMLSYWVYFHETAVRYFAMLYPLGVLAVLYLRIEKGKKVVYSVLTAAVVFGAVDAGYLLFTSNVVMPEDRMSITDARNFPVEENAVYFGNYWSVYMPGMFHAHKAHFFEEEGGSVRNQHQRKQVLHSGKRFFVIRNDWLDDFPEKLNQFGHDFQLVGEAQMHGKWEYAEYAILE